MAALRLDMRCDLGLARQLPDFMFRRQSKTCGSTRHSHRLLKACEPKAQGTIALPKADQLPGLVGRKDNTALQPAEKLRQIAAVEFFGLRQHNSSNLKRI